MWKQSGKQKIPEPVRGKDEEFDGKNEVVEGIRERIDEYIESVKKETGCKKIVLFTSNAKFRFQIEFPEGFEVDIDEFTLTSKAKGKDRYMT